MPSFLVATATHRYFAKVEPGILTKNPYYIPDTASLVFMLTTEDVWRLYGSGIERAMGPRPHQVLDFPGGEENKRLARVEELAEQMVAAGGDRASVMVAVGGGIVTDVGGFLASVFMRGIPVIQVPTTLLAQVDAGVGGKTGVNLTSGKNLIGTFHQPLCVLIDPEVLRTLPPREYRAGLFEVIKCGIIRSPRLFELLEERAADVLAQEVDTLAEIISESVRIKAEVVSADEKESDLRRILNFGHTFGHALESETSYTRFLHGEAVAFGMTAAIHLALLLNVVDAHAALRMAELIRRYGPIPPLGGISSEAIVNRLKTDKKSVKGKVHFVLPETIGKVQIVADVDPELVLSAVKAALP